MRVALASDHRGFKLKNVLLDFLKEEKYTVVDMGTFYSQPCDYPDVVYPAAVAVKEKKVDRAVLLCYTGIGSCIVANKVKGIRAGLVYNSKIARLSRRHNNTNVLVLPAGFLKKEEAKKIVKVWLTTKFEGGRHLRRVKKIKDIEGGENV